MADPFVAEIRVFAGNFAPRGWAFCDGQLLPLSQNVALFSLLGTIYGGDGRSTFALPNLQGSVPMHPGQGPGLSLHDLGESSGAEYLTLLESEIPAHTHTLRTLSDPGDLADPSTRSLARSRGGNVYQQNSIANLTPMGPLALQIAGGSQPHNNLQPYLALNFIIALQGVFPPHG
jgi:microcystin-dependent protein